jgi:UDP-N-acetylglucosamine 2-epimerase (non-hydrolysing)
MIDTLLANVATARATEAWLDYGLDARRYVLVTLHRPALVDSLELLRRTMEGLERIARELPVVFPVHPRTRARLAELRLDEGAVQLVDPQPYSRFLALEAEAAAVVTDSGGVQEETTVLGIPCFTLRDNTERPVTVSHGTNLVLGLDPGRLAEIPDQLRRPRPTRIPPLWDGRAGERAAERIEQFLGLAMEMASAGAGR